MTAKINTFLGFVFFCAMVLQTGCDDECKSLGGDAKLCGPAEVSLELSESYPFVEATLNGEPVNILLDTGVAYYVDTPSFGYVSASLLGVAESMVSVGSICLGEMCFEDIPIYAVDTPFSDPGDDAINGTLGMGLLRYFDLEFDQMETLSLSYTGNISGESDPFESCEESTYGISYSEYGTPYAAASADDLDLGDLLLDTGAYYTLFNQETVDLIGDYLLEDAVEEGGCSFEGCTDDGYLVSTLNQYCVFEECVENLKVKYPVWNVIGCSYLKNYRVVFSFDSDEIALCPTS